MIAKQTEKYIEHFGIDIGEISNLVVEKVLSIKEDDDIGAMMRAMDSVGFGYYTPSEEDGMTLDEENDLVRAAFSAFIYSFSNWVSTWVKAEVGELLKDD